MVLRGARQVGKTSAPELYVICASSLLEALIDEEINFPVGRVEYAFMHTLTFEEFLQATGETASYEMVKSGRVESYAHDAVTKLFQRYVQLGGMPEIIAA